MTIQRPLRPVAEAAATSAGRGAEPREAGAAGSAAGPAEEGPRLHGVVDVVRGAKVAGWVIDRSDPRLCAEVTVRREGRLVATLRADRPRRDLEQGGVGTGRYGFAVALDPPLEPGLEFTVRVTARTDDGIEAILRPPSTGKATAPDRRLSERIWEDQAELAATARRVEEGVQGMGERLARALDRIEVMQARLEAHPALAAPPGPAGQGSVRLMVGVALVLALGSLGLGAWSLWAG